jgi:hypothetical protein
MTTQPMKMVTQPILCFALLASTLAAQSISVVNSSNSMISPSAVVGDIYVVTITGAAANSLVALNYVQNGTPGEWDAGYTDSNGDWSQTAPPKSTAFIGVWTEQWSVGGTNIGINYSFEVFDEPVSQTVVSVAASSPNACGNSYAGRGTATYGPSAAIHYQINGSSGSSETVPSSGLMIMMEPYESVVEYDPLGNQTFSGSSAIGCSSGVGPGCPSGWAWTPPGAFYASTSGQYYDVPLSSCASVFFSNYKFGSQVTSIIIGSNVYQVASQDWYAVSSSSGHGTLTNSLETVNFTQ